MPTFLDFYHPNKLDAYSSRLCADLTARRIQKPDRPIIFVVHNLGGFVCANALVTSNAEQHVKQISTCTRGIIFLGTPLQGSQKVDWPEYGRQCAQHNDRVITSAINNFLGEGGHRLEELASSFAKVLRYRAGMDNDINAVFIHDQLGFEAISPTDTKDPATLAEYETQVIPTGHASLTEFDSADEVVYVRVKEVLGRWIEALQKTAKITQPLDSRPEPRHDAKLKGKETSVDSPSASTSLPQHWDATDWIPESERLPGDVSPSASSTGCLSDISIGSEFDPEEADMDNDAFDPERKDTDTEHSRRVERFASPEKWLARLERMKNQVVAASYIHRRISLLMASTGESNSGEPSSISSPLAIAPNEKRIFTWDDEDVTDMMTGVMANVETMQDSGYCAESVNFLALETNRPSVARLIRVGVDDIKFLVERLRDAFLCQDSVAIVQSCANFLALLGFTTAGSGTIGCHIDTASNETDERSGYGSIQMVRVTLLLVDLAILSYSGAHVENLHDGLPIATQLRFSATSEFSLTPRRFKCLDACLNRPVWVFEMSNLKDTQDRSTALYLSAEIADFASIWGPVRAVTEPDKEDVVIRYDVGLGSISCAELGPDQPEPLDGEVFCHWFPASGDAPPRQSKLNGSRLLVG